MKNFDFWLKWTSTGLLVFGAIASSANIFPLNIIFSFIGNAGWAWAGFRMKEPSLWSVFMFSNTSIRLCCKGVALGRM